MRGRPACARPACARPVRWRVRAEQTVFGMHLTDQAELKKKFDAIDVDGNGTLEKHELKAALQATGRTVTDKKLTEIFNKYDNDKNGTFDFKE